MSVRSTLCIAGLLLATFAALPTHAATVGSSLPRAQAQASDEVQGPAEPLPAECRPRTRRLCIL